MYPWDGKNIYFLGFMGTGKSHVGKALAKLLGWPFEDTDHLIEKKAGLRIEQIFAVKGEPHFRALEDQVIEEIAEKRHWIFSLGGGAVVREQNWQLIEKTGLTICLHADREVLYQRLARKSHRPLIKGLAPDAMRQRINSLLAERQPYYDRAQYTFESSEKIRAEELAEQIFTQLRDDI